MNSDPPIVPKLRIPEPLPATAAGAGATAEVAAPFVSGVDLTSEPARAAPAGFWRRRLVNPVLALLTQGVTPDRLAATLAVGTVCSVFPFLGTTSVLNLGAGLWLRLNHPILQTLNQLLGPLQLLLILVYVRIGEWMWGLSGSSFTVDEVVRTFREANFSTFLERFGWAGVHAFSAWAVTAPLLLVVIYYGLRPALRRAAELRRGTRTQEGAAGR